MAHIWSAFVAGKWKISSLLHKCLSGQIVGSKTVLPATKSHTHTHTRTQGEGSVQFPSSLHAAVHTFSTRERQRAMETLTFILKCPVRDLSCELLVRISSEMGTVEKCNWQMLAIVPGQKWAKGSKHNNKKKRKNKKIGAANLQKRQLW